MSLLRRPVVLEREKPSRPPRSPNPAIVVIPGSPNGLRRPPAVIPAEPDELVPVEAPAAPPARRSAAAPAREKLLDADYLWVSLWAAQYLCYAGIAWIVAYFVLYPIYSFLAWVVGVVATAGGALLAAVLSSDRQL